MNKNVFFLVLFFVMHNIIIAEEKSNVDISFLYNKKFDKGMKTTIGEYTIEDLMEFPGCQDNFLLKVAVVRRIDGQWKKVGTLEDFQRAKLDPVGESSTFDKYIKFRNDAELNNALYCAQGFIVQGVSDCSYCSKLMLPMYVYPLERKIFVLRQELNEMQNKLDELEEQKNNVAARLQKAEKERSEIEVIK